MTEFVNFGALSRGMISRRGLIAGAVGLAGAMAVGGGATQAARPTLVAAASSLRFVVDEIVSAFQREAGDTVKISFGATGTLVAQIESGAPFEVFLAADVASPQRLAKAGLTVGAPRIFATGEIAVAAAKNLGIEADDTLAGLGRVLEAGMIRRFAIANPELAPYGAAARQALMAAGLWERVQPRLAMGENIGQAAQFVASGAAQAGMMARSLAISPEISGRLQVFGVSKSLYTPIDHGMAVLNGARKEARAFAAFLEGPTVRDILIRGGFSV